MSGFWGFHSQAQGVSNAQRLVDYHRGAQPPWTLVMDGDGLAAELKAVSAKTNVISRHYFPDGTWYRATPADYLDYLDRAEVAPVFWNFVENESGINPDWNSALIKLNAQRKTPRQLVILNEAVGNPEKPEEWQSPKVLELLRLCDQYREWCVVGLHEYFIGVVTSGFIGGAPDHAGVPLGETGGDNLIARNYWPPKSRSLTRFHMGRFQFIVDACKAHGIRPPRVVLTEAGADDVSDIKAWAQTLRLTPPYESIRGWRSLVEQWKIWYPGISADRVYAMMLGYAADTIYDGTVVEGGCVYCYGTPDPQWQQFNVEDAIDFINSLEVQTVTAIPAAPTMPVVVKSSDTTDVTVTVTPVNDKVTLTEPSVAIPTTVEPIAQKYAKIAELLRALATEFEALAAAG